jgi:CRISPR-associated exonuclease Cas4
MGPIANDDRPGVDEPPDPIPLSALQHWAYCPRQCGLIHLDQVFDDNVHTLRGQAVHAQVDQPGFELRKGVRIERALPVWNDALGLIGKTDAVEFDPASGAPYPVEYKHGSRNKAADIAHADDVQLAAQSLCLAEMTGHAVTEGALYYASSKRRRVVPITPALQAEVVEIAAAFRQMLATGTLPAPTTDTRRCRACSLIERCQPEAWRRLNSTRDLHARLFDPDAE